MESGRMKKNSLAYWRRKISEKLKFPFYTREQVYSVKYRVRVVNDSAVKRDYQLVLPIPQETHYQTIIKQPIFEPANFVFLKDNAYGNSAALFRDAVDAQGYRDSVINFEVKVIPRVTSIRDDLFKSHLCKHVNFTVNSNDYHEFDCKKEFDDVLDKLRCLNDKVVEKLDYGNPIPGLYTALQALSLEKVDCGGFDSLLGALAFHNGMEARIVSGFWAGYDTSAMHAWLEVKLPDGRVVPLDPSVEHLAKQGRTKKSGAFGYLGSDRIVFSFGCCLPFIINGQEIKIDLLQHPYLLPHDPDLRAELNLSIKRL